MFLQLVDLVSGKQLYTYKYMSIYLYSIFIYINIYIYIYMYTYIYISQLKVSHIFNIIPLMIVIIRET